MTVKWKVPPHPTQQPLLPLLESGRLLGMGRTATYDAHRRGRFPVPVLQVGGRLMCRTADLRRFLGLDSGAA